MLVDFINGTYKQRHKALEDMLYTQLDALFETGQLDKHEIDPLDVAAGGHAIEKHATPLSDEQLISRIIKEDVGGVSYFMSPRVAYDSILNAAIYKSDEICNWQMKEPSEFQSQKDYHSFTISVYLGNDILGRCFQHKKDKITELDCHTITVGLKRNPEAPCGFSVTTAFPNPEKATPTGREFRPKDIIEKGLYRFRSNVEKVAYLCSSYMKNVNIEFHTYKGNDYLRLYSKKNGVRYVSYFDEKNWAEINRISGNQTQSLLLSELKEEYPELEKNIRWAKAMIFEGEHAMQKFIKEKTEEQAKKAPLLDDKLLMAKDKLKKREHGDKAEDIFHPSKKESRQEEVKE